MRSGYVQKLDNGNWEVVERDGRHLEPLSGPGGFASEHHGGALRMAGIDTARSTRVADKHPGRERWEWEADA